MAYLDPRQRTCPQCGLTGTVTLVVGVGPNSQPGVAPYKRILRFGPFDKDPGDGLKALCPECGVHVS